MLLSKEDARKVLKALGLSREQLPWIRALDPMAHYIGAKPGDVIKIIRKSYTAGSVVVYRYVIPG